jgi:hypothetical protein
VCRVNGHNPRGVGRVGGCRPDPGGLRASLLSAEHTVWLYRCHMKQNGIMFVELVIHAGIVFFVRMHYHLFDEVCAEACHRPSSQDVDELAETRDLRMHRGSI